MWRFQINHADAPAPFVLRVSGIAYCKQKSARFYMTISPVFMALSVDPSSVGRKLIAHFIRMFGKPTLKYHDRHDNYEDYTVEWHLNEDKKAIAQRIQGHLALGFAPSELP